MIIWGYKEPKDAPAPPAVVHSAEHTGVVNRAALAAFVAYTHELRGLSPDGALGGDETFLALVRALQAPGLLPFL